MIFRTAEIAGYESYHAWLVGTRLRPAIRVASLFVVALNSFFLLLDYLVYPDKIAQFAALRFAWIVAMIGVYLAVNKLSPLVSTRAGCLLTGMFLIALSGLGGGVTSSYWPALMVLFLGMPVLMPLTARQAAEIVLILTTCFAALPVLTGELIGVRAYGVPVFFVVSTAIECVMSAAVLDGMRFSDFQSRLEVEEARDHLREMDRAKTRFTANIHHELRTPLTMILSPLAALRSGDYGDLPSAIESVITTMEVNGRRLHRLINNLLDLAKLESDQFQIHRRPMSILQLVNDIVAGVQPMAARKRISVRVEGFSDLQPLYADFDAIDKVIVNLVGNALKFTGEGGQLVIWGGPVPGGGTRVEVRDTGVGIPADQLSRFFDRFAQIDASSTRRYEGTGIGLSLACELVELHSGRIWAESDGIGCGTTMCFELPQGFEDCLDSAATNRANEGEEDLSRGQDGSTAPVDGRDTGSESIVDRTVDIERTVDRWIENEGHQNLETLAVDHAASVPEVLIAEDNPDMRKLLHFLLAKEFRVRVARNGKEALREIQVCPPHVLISDVMMPEMSGIELCEAVKSDRSTAHIPVMLVTSKAEDEMKIGGLELGADDYITKPFHPRELMARVRSLSRVRTLQEELESNNQSLERALRELKSAQLELVRKERLAAVGEMAAGVAHEVNNPVNFALNAARVLQSEVDEICEALDLGSSKASDRENSRSGGDGCAGGTDPNLDVSESVATIHELAGIIADGLDRTHRLVGELQDFSGSGRRESGRVDVLSGIRSTIALLRPTLSARGVEVAVDISAVELIAEADAGALNQVFMNVLKNAADAVRDEAGSVTVRAWLEEDEVVVTISDTGSGIEANVLSRVFEPFYSTKASGVGSGLGLPISRRIVEEFGGSLSIESDAGSGSTVSVRLPRADVD